MKDWLYASKKDIDNMTFDEARGIIEKHIRLGHESGEYRPREHITKALEMILERAIAYENRKE